jgi:predicted nucleic acid-binding protein
MSIVFADTVGLVALWNRSDQWHGSATQAFARLRPNEDEFLTSRYVLLECGNALARTLLRERVDRFREQMEIANVLVEPTEDDWREAWKSYRLGEANEVGIVDHVSFVVMRRLNINRAFTNDNHFRAAGFEILFD